MNFKKLIKFDLIVSLLCLICLTHETYRLVFVYLERNTISVIDFIQNKITKLPGITIGYRPVFSFDKVVAKNKDYFGVYENYTKFLKTIPDYDIIIYNRTLRRKYEEYYLGYYKMLTEKGIFARASYRYEKDLRELFDLTMNFNNPSKNFENSSEPCIKIFVSGENTRGNSGDIEMNNFLTKYPVNFVPMETWLIKYDYKLFTIFR